MRGIIRVYCAKRYLGAFSTKRTLVWVADIYGLTSEKRQLTCSGGKARVLSYATAESRFTGFAVIQSGRDKEQDAETRE